LGLGLELGSGSGLGLGLGLGLGSGLGLGLRLGLRPLCRLARHQVSLRRHVRRRRRARAHSPTCLALRLDCGARAPG
jgi:hypothetical protein